jgi:hypothetical protein
MAEVKALAKLFVHWPDDLRREDGTWDVFLAAAKRQVPGVVDILCLRTASLRRDSTST